MTAHCGRLPARRRGARLPAGGTVGRQRLAPGAFTRGKRWLARGSLLRKRKQLRCGWHHQRRLGHDRRSGRTMEWCELDDRADAAAARCALHGAFCRFVLAASACTAVGSTTAPGFGTVAERWNGSASESWNGTSWALQSSANVAGAVLTSVSCVTSSACTAVGATDNGATTASVTGHQSPGGLAFSRGRGRTDAGSGSA